MEIYFAGGCFWGTEAYFRSVAGVTDTQVGYANGTVPDPTYELVCRGDSGYAETVRVRYDPAAAPLDFLLELYFKSINPTAVNRQGNDRGSQYRTGIYYVEAADRPVIDRAMERLAARVAAPLAVEVAQLRNFYPAEEYHQRYLEKNPGGATAICPRRSFRRRGRRGPKGAMRSRTTRLFSVGSRLSSMR